MPFPLENELKGKYGEQMLYEALKNTPNVWQSQIDKLVRLNLPGGPKWFTFECKHQEHYKNPDGHGLPPWQARARLQLQKECGIRAVFYVIELDTDVVYWQFFDILEQSEFFFSKSETRKIYPLSAFNISKVGAPIELIKLEHQSLGYSLHV